MTGVGRYRNTLFVIDMGLVKRFRDSKTRAHIPYRDGRPLVGTARYVSVNLHKGIEPTRRDDMESIGYLFVYFLKGTLPWMELKAANKQQKYEKIAEKVGFSFGRRGRKVVFL